MSKDKILKTKKGGCEVREFLESCPFLRFVPRLSVAALDELLASTSIWFDLVVACPEPGVGLSWHKDR